ncbi:TrmH family RNA methyltransferase [Patescibacteria group bacterium]|nr:MAG: TrmH family RNA methyltransferase [Patescibacteria group bacterium]
MTQLILILDDLRSTANVGSILRSADSFAVELVYACGSTPYPRLVKDERDPVVINRNSRAIARAALGAEQTVRVEHIDSSIAAIEACRQNGWTIIGLEQDANATPMHQFKPPQKTALVVGAEVTGLSQATKMACDQLVEIAQFGSKESLNVAVATGIALYRLRSESV